MPYHSGHMISTILLIQRLHAGRSSTLPSGKSDKAPAPSMAGPQKVPAMCRKGIPLPSRRGAGPFTEKRLRIFIIRGQFQHHNKLFYPEPGTSLPWYCAEGAHVRKLLQHLPITPFNSKAGTAARFHPTGNRQHIRAILKLKEDKKEQYLVICLPSNISMRTLRNKLGFLPPSVQDNILRSFMNRNHGKSRLFLKHPPGTPG